MNRESISLKCQASRAAFIVSLIVLLVLIGCGSNDDSPALDVDNMALTNAGLYTLHVTPSPMNPDSRLDVALEVVKEISGRLLLIDLQGEILHSFHEGDFTEGTHQYAYAPESELPPGNYLIVLADNSNLVLERHDVTCTENVLGSM